MIPAKIIRFLEQHANLAFAGIRDRHMVPSGCRVSAWQVHPDGQTVTVFIPQPLIDRVIELLEDNGHLALTVEEHPTHETYQFKGRYLKHRAVEPDDLSLVARVRERLVRTYRAQIPAGVPESYVMRIAVPTPAIAVDVEIREVYLQTPGPGAGARIYPPAEDQASGAGPTPGVR